MKAITQMKHIKSRICNIYEDGNNFCLSMKENSMESTSERNSEHSWAIFGKRIPKSEMQYITQVIIIYIVIITCIINLSISNGDSNLWTALLSSCLGYILPNPTMKNKPA